MEFYNKLTFQSSKTLFTDFNNAVDKFNKAWKLLPNYAEYNSELATQKREKAEQSVTDTFYSGVLSIIESADRQVKKLDENIMAKKYPLLQATSASPYIDAPIVEAKKLRGTLEYSTALNLLEYLSPNYPSLAYLEEFYNTGRIDLVSALIELATKIIPTGLDISAQREKFNADVNTIYDRLGILDFMKEKLELEYSVRQMNIQIEAFNMNRKNSPDTLMKFGVQEMFTNRDFTEAMKKLNVKK
jgi:hypothetical protein